MKEDNIYFSGIRFPWETFAMQAEREERERANDDERWTDEFLAEVRQNILRYAGETEQAIGNSCLNEVYMLAPFHFRNELFSGVDFPIWN